MYFCSQSFVYITITKKSMGNCCVSVGWLLSYLNKCFYVDPPCEFNFAMASHSCPEASSASKDESSNKTLKRLYLAIGLCSIFMIVEIVGGWLANSLAIISDAVHLLSGKERFVLF